MALSEVVISTITNEIANRDNELERVKSSIRDTQDHLDNLIGHRERIQQERDALAAFLEEHE